MASVHEGSGNGHPQKRQSRSQNPLAFHFGGLQNLLKLRTAYRFNEKLSALVGADLNLQKESAFPVATLQYEVCLRPPGPEDQHELELSSELCADPCQRKALGRTASNDHRHAIQEVFQLPKAEIQLQNHTQGWLHISRQGLASC